MSRPLRCEDPEQLFFVTTRTLEEVFWLHPLLCSRLAPRERERATVFAQPQESTGIPAKRNENSRNVPTRTPGTCRANENSRNVPPFLPRPRNQRGIRRRDEPACPAPSPHHHQRTCHRFCPDPGTNGESDGATSPHSRQAHASLPSPPAKPVGTCHRFCPAPGINGESGGAMSRYAHRQAHASFASPPV